MRCTVVAVGRAGNQLRALFDEYAKRLNPLLGLLEIEERRKLPDLRLREREAELLLGATPKNALIVALDEAGTEFTSREFAARLGDWRDRGVADLAFLIGGASGHGLQVRERAGLTWSLGRLTWPHLLVRVLVAEQLYRGFSILSDHPYHRQ
jgi:23S rRNA (pseudouridine1915-N3)-methyltransferase